MSNRKVDVKINNIEYTLISNEPEEYVQRVALLVNKVMTKVLEGAPQLSTAQAAALSAINLADELLKSEAVVDNLRVEINNYIKLNKESSEELESKKLEVEELKEDMHTLQIELAKRETEINNLKNAHSGRR